MNKALYRSPVGRAQWLLAIGNEVDVYLPDPQAWLRYIDFYGQLTANGINGNPTVPLHDFAALFGMIA